MRLLPALLIVGILAGAGAAHAGGADPAGAEALFREGREAMRRGDPVTACARFEESQRLDPSPGTLLNMAECEEAQGKLASAWAHLRELVDTLPPEDDRAPVAARKASALDKRVPRLRIRLAPTTPSGARVRRDGVDVGAASLGVALPVDPGRHVVTVETTGRRARSYAVALDEGANRDVVVEGGEPSGDAASDSGSGSGSGSGSASSPASGSPNRAPGWILLGAGGAAAVVGTVTGVLAIDRNATMNRVCDADRFCPQEGVDAGRQGRTFDVVSTVSFVTAGVLVAGGIAWLVTHPRGEAR